jgi:TatA/E family protein of Tat protein translocase
VFEGLFSPWHLIIIAGVVFLVFGPNKLADRWKSAARSVREFTGEPHPATEATTTPPEAAPERRRRPSVAYRIGRRLRRH